MAKKDFKNSPAMGFITNTMKNEQSYCDEYEDIGTEKSTDNDKTQGRKGKKLPRLNMAFYNNNLDYVQKIAGIKGISATAYINQLIDMDKEKNKEIYEKIKNINYEL